MNRGAKVSRQQGRRGLLPGQSAAMIGFFVSVSCAGRAVVADKIVRPKQSRLRPSCLRSGSAYLPRSMRTLIPLGMNGWDSG